MNRVTLTNNHYNQSMAKILCSNIPQTVMEWGFPGNKRIYTLWSKCLNFFSEFLCSRLKGAKLTPPPSPPKPIYRFKTTVIFQD